MFQYFYKESKICNFCYNYRSLRQLIRRLVNGEWTLTQSGRITVQLVTLSKVRFTSFLIHGANVSIHKVATGSPSQDTFLKSLS